MNFNEIHTQIKEISLDEIWNENAENGLTHLHVNYQPDTEKLTIIGNFTDDSEPYYETVGEFDCKPEVVAVLFTGIINNPFWVTPNTQKPANISVEYGAFR